jgi:CBS domain-containing protein
MQRTVQDVMTRGVVVARESTPFHEMVALLSREHTSALPVIDDGAHVIGIVSESDLLLKEIPDLASPRDSAELTLRERQERAKAAGTTARQVMTTPVVIAFPTEPVAEVARRMHNRGLHQLPVVDQAGVLAGIISRADVLKIFLRNDREIRFELLDDVITKLLRLQGHPLDVEVEGGVVTLTGTLPRRSQAVAMVELARSVDGVVAVRSHLAFDRDDLDAPARGDEQPPARLSPAADDTTAGGGDRYAVHGG